MLLAYQSFWEKAGVGFFNLALVISPFRAVTELESEVRVQDQLVP